jgi:hypothetical protein
MKLLVVSGSLHEFELCQVTEISVFLFDIICFTQKSTIDIQEDPIEDIQAAIQFADGIDKKILVQSIEIARKMIGTIDRPLDAKLVPYTKKIVNSMHSKNLHKFVPLLMAMVMDNSERGIFQEINAGDEVTVNDKGWLVEIIVSSSKHFLKLLVHMFENYMKMATALSAVKTPREFHETIKVLPS